MRRALAVEGDGLALNYIPVRSVPVRPPDLQWRTTRLELNAHVDVLCVAHYRAPMHMLRRICRVARIAIGNPVFERDGLSDIKSPRQQDLRKEQVLADLLDPAAARTA